MKKGFFTIAILAHLCLPAMADDADDVEVFLKGNLDTVITLLQDKSLTEGERNGRVVDTVTEAFDFSKMAKLTLGRKHWPALSGEQKKRFTTLFVERLKVSYVDKLNLYTDEKVIFKPAVRVKNKLHVMTELVSRDNKIGMLYKLYKSKKKGWQVYDVEIQGVSLITTYRSQFNEVLRTGTIDDLFMKLEKAGVE